MARELTRSDVREIVRETLQETSRGLATGIIDVVDGPTFRASLQRVLQGEEPADVKLFHPYGFVSVEHPGMETLFVPILGSSGNPARAGVNDAEHRPKDLEAGDSAWYSDEGDVVALKRGRQWLAVIGNLIRLEVGANVIEIDQASGKITVDAAGDVDVKAGGNAKVSGVDVDIDATGDVTVTATGAINLGGLGGAAVARVGDTVAGGVITTGSAKVSAVA